MIVQKYGGTSVASVEKIKAVAKFIKDGIGSQRAIIVVSAMAGVTDGLLSLTKEICDEPDGREVDQIISVGENQVAGLLTLALKSLGMQAKSLTAMQVGFKTDANFGNAFIEKIDKKKLLKNFKNYQILVVTGFQGVSKNGDVTTLGKGGSDTTAVSLASLFKCPCEIFTDVNGIFTVDPKLFYNAKKISKISYDELMEMSVGGAKVMETRSTEIAKKFNTKLYIGQSLVLKKEGTKVGGKVKNFEYMPIKNLTAKDNVMAVEIACRNNQDIENIVEILSEKNQKLEMFSQNKNTVKFLIDDKNFEKISKKIKNKLKLGKIIKNLCKITLTGSGFATHSLIVKEIYEVLNREEIYVSSLVVNEVSLNFTIEQNLKKKAMEILAKHFNLLEGK